MSFTVDNYPNIAVLLAAYNGMAWIEEQVESILNQVDVSIHVYISVDLSSDGTMEWCNALQDRCENVTVLEYGQCYGGAAQNFFRLIKEVDFTGFDYVSFADQDDIWLESKLSRSVKCLNLEKASVYSSDVIAFWSDGREVLVKKSYPQKKFDFLFESGGPGCTFVFTVGSLTIFKEFMLSRWLEVNDVGKGQHDWLMYAFFRSNGFSWFIDSVPLMRYRQHASNHVGFNSGLSAYFKRLSMIKSKWYRGQVEKLLCLVPAEAVKGFKLNKIFLLQNIRNLRRRRRDSLILACLIVIGVF